MPICAQRWGRGSACRSSRQVKLTRLAINCPTCLFIFIAPYQYNNNHCVNWRMASVCDAVYENYVYCSSVVINIIIIIITIIIIDIEQNNLNWQSLCLFIFSPHRCHHLPLEVLFCVVNKFHRCHCFMASIPNVPKRKSKTLITMALYIFLHLASKNANMLRNENS